MRSSLILPLAVLALGAACQPKPAAAPAAAAVDTAAAQAAIAATRSKYSAQQIAGDATGVAALFDENAALDVYGVPRTVGRANIETALKGMYGMRKFSVSDINPITTTVRTNDDGSEIGTYHDMYDEKGAKTHEWGRYVVGLAKGTDGVWRLTYLMAFPDSIKVEK